ncbi:DUF262 domain-containing protein [Aphanothece sacrum]|uniref:GmrSD restriction endonucleases N-terminal domain-containing protein n=1 Tax=Aphanothece sacrum FPU1 TaxID=1920663 RepID=A0A401IKY3_APHSA|nr:DUF262 domain-containing protein [Aphanothece sacrum]GBF81898.1 hypothetical protein AsFPU1_3320 [Aphanothece sacrum FPU1]GBF83528.1 hypothetical protein AsFPU3_0570 [Aphanothece sacrum FPU3]
MSQVAEFQYNEEELAEEFGFDDAQNESDSSEFNLKHISDIVVYGTDWTTETILNQLNRKNINLNPRFQRRDAWTIKRKSRFIESLILGIPVPQIVLAEKEKGKYLVLDGKQRLLTILQFYNKSESPNNNFKLKELEFLSNLNSLKLQDFENNPLYSQYLDALDNQTIRTTIIKNWQSENFLYKVFLRLNAESTPLSPQELRQALNPGKFTDYIDDQSIKSKGLKAIFTKQPDFRMRDNQLLLKYIAFQYFLPEYRGDLKNFVDKTSKRFNDEWEKKQDNIEETIQKFEKAVEMTIRIFGEDNFSKIWLQDKATYERQRNLSLLDTILFYFSDAEIRQKVEQVNKIKIEEAFKTICSSSPDFISSVKSSTNTITNTHRRLALWGKALQEVLEIDFNIPELINNHLVFSGFR